MLETYPYSVSHACCGELERFKSLAKYYSLARLTIYCPRFASHVSEHVVFSCGLKFVVNADDSIYAPRELPCFFQMWDLLVPCVVLLKPSCCSPSQAVLDRRNPVIQRLKWGGAGGVVGPGSGIRKRNSENSGEGGEKPLVLEVNYSKVW